MSQEDKGSERQLEGVVESNGTQKRARDRIRVKRYKQRQGVKERVR